MEKISIDAYFFFSMRTLLLIFSILSVMATSVYPVQSISTTTVSVFPSTVTASVGHTFSMDVKIANVFDLYGWEFRLSWNPSLLDVVNVVEGPFLKTGGDTYFTYRRNDTAGYLIADCTLLGMVHGVSDNGVLATITFYVKNVGECPLDLNNVILLNSLEEAIPCEAVDAYGYFTYPHDVAITNVSASPLTVLQGEIVKINATAQNQGGYSEVFNVTLYANSEIIGVQSVSLNNGSSTIIPFTWNTTGFGKGDYTVSASASVVQGEVDAADNTKLADNVVTILYPGHDVAVIGVEPFKTVVGQGYIMYIAVTVKNYGIFGETFDTTVYVNKTGVQTQPVSLTSGNSITLIFTWNTTEFAKGNYIIGSYAWPVSNETDTADNTFTNGVARVTVAGDIIEPFDIVDMTDIGCICLAYGVGPGNPRWNPNADITNNDIVDMTDIGIACLHYGQCE